ncbi:MAG: hypothetical protein WCI73_15175 [Phycisphaerae bacterium]
MMKDTIQNSDGLRFESQVHFGRERKGRKRLQEGAATAPEAVPQGRVPRLARLMALAIHFEDLLRSGQVKDLADLARLGHVTRARVTQIMNLRLLAPDIQESLLALPLTKAGSDPIHEWQVRPIAAELNWQKQRGKWRSTLATTSGDADESVKAKTDSAPLSSKVQEGD